MNSSNQITCIDRGVYRIQSRHLTSVGVFIAEAQGFCGVRAHWKNAYLFTERHWAVGTAYSSAHPIDLLYMLPSDIENREKLGDRDPRNGRAMARSGAPMQWRYLDNGEIWKQNSAGIELVPNIKLFEFLQTLENQNVPFG